MDIPQEIESRLAKTKNQHNYLAYIRQLINDGKKFSLNKDKDVNISEVARVCDFGRDCLYGEGKIATWFKRDLKLIGNEGVASKKSNDDFLSEKADQKSKDASKLQTQLDVKVQ